MKKNVFTFALALLAAASAWAYDFKAGDLYYNITDEAARTVEVTYEYEWDSNNYSSLSGAVSIPETVSYGSTKYSVKSIGEGAFYSCSALTQVNIPNSVTSIGNSAFWKCSALTQVTIPNSVTSIGNYAFRDCSALTQVTIGSGVTSIGDCAFQYCSALTQVTIPNSVTSIGGMAFYGCSALTQVNIGNGVTNIGDYAFQNCSALTAINMEGSNTTYCSENGVLFNKEKTMLMQYPAGKPETVYTIPESVTSIGTSAFEGCFSLTQITISNSVTSIGDYAFYACSTLTQVTIPSSVASIGNKAFYECYSITQVTWNAINCADFKSSDYNPFYDIRSNITNFIFGEQVEHIPACLCYGMDKLTEVTIPSSITSIGSETFYECSALTAVYYTGDVAGWCGITFDYYDSNPLYYAHNLYIDNTLVTRLNIPGGITEIKDYTFLGCDALRQTTIPNSVTSIGNSAFYGCSKLTQVTLPNSVTSIGSGAFNGCSALRQVTIPDGVTSIGDWAFYECNALTQVTIGNSVTSIGNSAFSYCSALTEMTVLATVPPTVGYDAFYDVNREIPVYVPAEALEDYWVAAVWEEFYYLQAMPANALQTPSMPESISVYGGMLHNPQGLPVSLYDMQGRMVYCGTAATVSQPAGVYVLRCAGASSKVLF